MLGEFNLSVPNKGPLSNSATMSWRSLTVTDLTNSVENHATREVTVTSQSKENGQLNSIAYYALCIRIVTSAYTCKMAAQVCFLFLLLVSCVVVYHATNKWYVSKDRHQLHHR